MSNFHSPFSILHPPSSIFHFPDTGQSLVEFALTVPVLLLILMAIFDMGRAVYAQNVITNAAREGARYGTIAPDDSQGIAEHAESLTFGLDTAIQSQQISDSIRVTITHEFAAVTPLIGDFVGQNGTLTLQAVSTMDIESSG